MQAEYMTVVIKLPPNQDERATILDLLSLTSVFHGGVVSAVSLADEITRVERYEELYGELDADDSRPDSSGCMIEYLNRS
jgi:hypothetical protein